MKKLLTIMMIVFAINANSQTDEFYSSTRKIDQFTRGYVVSAGIDLLVHEGLRLTCKDMKHWKRKVIAMVVSVGVTSLIDSEENEYSIAGGLAGSLTVTFLIPNRRKNKREKTKFKHYKL